MRGNEVVNTDLFNIRSWFIKKNLRNISGSIAEMIRNFESVLTNVFLF